MKMCHHTKDTTNYVSSSLIFKLNKRGEKLKPYVILKNTVFKKEKQLLNSTYWKYWVKHNLTGSLHSIRPFMDKDVSTLCLAIALLHLYLSQRNWICLEWHMNEPRSLKRQYQTYQQGLPINQPPVLWKLKKILRAQSCRPNTLITCSALRLPPKPLANVLSRYHT